MAENTRSQSNTRSTRGTRSTSRRKKGGRASRSFTIQMQRFFIGANIVGAIFLWLSAASVYISPSTFSYASVIGLAFPVFLLTQLLFIPFWLLFSWRKVWLPFTAIALCGGSVMSYWPVSLPSVPPKDAIKVVSYNTLNFGENRSDDEGHNELISYMVGQEADIFCFQEGLSARYDDWRKRNLSRFTNMPYVDTFKLSTLNVLGICSRYPIVGKHVLVEAAGNGSVAWLLAVNNSRDTIIVINNHLESYRLSSTDRASYRNIVTGREEANIEGGSRRLASKIGAAAVTRSVQADSVAAFIARQTLPLIVLGDFNDTPISYAYHTISQGLTDAYRRRGNGPGYSYDQSGIMVRIDHILCSPHWDIYATKVDRSVELSDHYPISAYLKLKR